MIEKKFKAIKALHLRPCAIFAKDIEKFESSIKIRKLIDNNNKSPEVNARSPFALTSLSIDKGNEFIISIQGTDEEKVIRSILDNASSYGVELKI